jgi:hypothetical protein
MAFWWQAETEEELGNRLAETVNQLKEDHLGRMQLNIDMLRMYTQRNYEALDRFEPSMRIGLPMAEDFRMRLNVVGNITDTLVSRLGKSRPRPMYLTKRGDYRLRTRAKKLTDAMEGIFHQVGMYDLMPKIFQDACIFDLAAMKVGRDGNDIFAERVFPNELLWDLNAAMYSEVPPSLHQTKKVPLEQMLLNFPENKDQIMYYSAASDSDYFGEEGHDAEMVECVESWHLPSINGANDGRHAITMDNLVLVDEQYNYPNYPFVTMTWGDSVLGWSGISLVESLKSIQFEINKLALRIQQAMHLVSVPWIFVAHGSRVVESSLRNAPGTVVNYVGQPPISYTPTAMSSEVYAHLDRLYQRAYEIAGVSELSATGRKPSGLDSGAALRTYHDIETERFITVGQKYEKAYMDAAKWFQDIAREIVKDSGSFPVKGFKRRALEELDFKDIDLAEKDYVLQAYPVSLLPSTPAGRLQAVTELIQNGVITQKEHIVRLLDFPDLESVTSLYDALERDVEWRISEILEDERYHAPEPVMDLAFAKERMTIAYLEAEQDGLELTKLDMMLRFIDECDALMQEGAAGPEILPEQAAAPGGETPELEVASLPGMETPMTETIDAAMPPQEGLPV